MALSSLKGRWGDAIIPVFIYGLLTLVPAFIDIIINISSYSNLFELLSNPNSFSPLDPSYMESIQAMNQMSKYTPISSLIFVYNIFATGALTIGFSILALKIIRREAFTPKTIFEGFRNFTQSIALYILYQLLCFAIFLIYLIPLIAFIASMIMESTIGILISALLVIAAIFLIIFLILRICMAFFIAADNRNLSATDALQHSPVIMKGNKGRFFLLNLSFIGWIILASIPLYIGILLMIFQSFSGEASMQMNVLGILLTVISLIAYCPLLLYLQTTIAVFYSNISGNFSTEQSPPHSFNMSDDTDQPKPVNDTDNQNEISSTTNPESGMDQDSSFEREPQERESENK